jgi:hypothetical protein
MNKINLKELKVVFAGCGCYFQIIKQDGLVLINLMKKKTLS